MPELSVTTALARPQPYLTWQPPSDVDSRINHVVEVVGWGVDDEGDECNGAASRANAAPLSPRVLAPLSSFTDWHVRNSWGAEWGENGFMRIVTSENNGPSGTGNNLIETECSYAVPDRYSIR